MVCSWVLVLGGDFTQAHAQGTTPAPAGDHVALTDLARTALLNGRDADALDLLQQAVALEPRDARSKTYLAVAYYRAGRIDEARQALLSASTIDDREPLSLLFAHVIETDLSDPSAAVAIARRAEGLTASLRSLQQIATDLQGQANLGYPFALFGQDEWSDHVAQETFATPWAASHLFLHNRYTGRLSRRSSFIQGLLADPLAIGASPRFDSLLARPGIYVTAGLQAINDRLDRRVFSLAPYATINGGRRGGLPLAFMVNVTRQYGFDVGDTPDELSRRVPSTTFAFGLAPTPQASVFVGVSRNALDDRYRDEANASDVTFDYSDQKVDVGVQYRFTPRSALSLKAGRAGGDGAYEQASVAGAPNLAPFTLDDDLTVEQLQVRNTIGFGRASEFSWGAESHTRRRDGRITFNHVPSRAETVTDAELFDAGLRVALDETWLLEGRIGVASQTDAFRLTETNAVPESPPIETIVESDDTRPTARAGIVYDFGEGRLARLVYQRWLRAPSESTLAPVATAGLAPEERLVGYNGLSTEARLQVEWTWTPSTFTTFFGGHQKIENPEAVSLFGPLQPPPGVLWPLYRVDATWLNEDLGDQAEDLSTLLRVTLDNVGASFNHIFDSQWTARARYEFTSSESAASHPPPGVPSAPYIPRHSLLFGATWASLSERLIVGGDFSYRSQYHVALPYVHTLEPLEGDWVANLRGAWELPNKRWSVEVSGRNLFAQDSPFTYATFTVDVRFRY